MRSTSRSPPRRSSLLNKALQAERSRERIDNRRRKRHVTRAWPSVRNQSHRWLRSAYQAIISPCNHFTRFVQAAVARTARLVTALSAPAAAYHRTDTMFPVRLFAGDLIDDVLTRKLIQIALHAISQWPFPISLNLVPASLAHVAHVAHSTGSEMVTSTFSRIEEKSGTCPRYVLSNAFCIRFLHAYPRRFDCRPKQLRQTSCLTCLSI